MGEWDEGQKTELDPFPRGRTDEVTKRRCGATCAGCNRVCGQELPPCDCADEARRVGIHVLDTLRDYLVARGIDPVGAARLVQQVARESGITLV